jgi:hypothetical protein
MLCQSCQQIFSCESDADASSKIKKNICYPVSLRLIHASGEKGCGLCAQLHKKLKTWERYGGDRYQLRYQLMEQFAFADRFKLSFKFTPSPTKSPSSPNNATSDLPELTSTFDFQLFTPECKIQSLDGGMDTSLIASRFR